MLVKLLLVAASAYVAICVLAFAAQGRLLFPAGAARGDGALPPGAERLKLAAADGTGLVGVHLAPRAGDPALPVILGFGGNAWNADSAAEYLSDVFPGADVVAFHYRGYAPSGGSPSAKALLADSLLVHDAVAARFPGRPVVAAGFSIGSAVAAHVAAARPVAGAILVTPFDSLAAVAAGHYPWLPVRPLWRHPMEPARELRQAQARVPIAILAGGRDTLIPAVRTDGFRRSIPDLVFDRTVAGAGHNDIYRASAFQQGLREALREILARRAGSRAPARTIGPDRRFPIVP